MKPRWSAPAPIPEGWNLPAKEYVWKGQVELHEGRNCVTQSVVAGAIVLGVLVAGCQKPASAPPLKEDPVLAAELKAEALREKEAAESRKALEAMTLADAANLEAVVRRNPEDLETRGRLLAFYGLTGRRLQSRDANVAAIRRHVAWVTEHHPDSILTNRIRRDEDPVGYAQMRKLWIAHIEKRDASLAVLNLASVFFVSEPKIYEGLLLRLQQLPVEPGEAGSIHDRSIMPVWVRLGSLYAQVLRSAGQPGSNVDAAYAADVKARLAVSRDGPLLATVAQFLVGAGPGPGADDDSLKTLGREYFQRAVALDPDHPQVGAVQRRMEGSTGWQTVGNPLGRASASGADVRDRRHRLACDAEMEYRIAGVMQEGERLVRARALAEEALAVAPTLPRDASSCDAMFRANVVLAAVAWRQGDRETTLRYLTEASKAPAPRLAAARSFPSDIEGKLTNSLLKHGERDTVAAYLERASKARTSADRTRMLEEAAAIRDGRMPARYQRLLAKGHV